MIAHGRFDASQVAAVRHAFLLAGFEGEIRTLPVESDHERIFILPLSAGVTMDDEYSLEVVLSRVLDRTVLVTTDMGAPTIPFA